MPDLRVDGGVLDGVAGRLRGVSGGLRVGGVEYGVLGDRMVIDAVVEFDARWGEVTGKLDANLGSLAGMVADAVVSYRDTDCRVAGALSVRAGL